MIKETRSADYEKILKFLEGQGEITTGIHANEGATQYPEGPSVIDIAEAAEYGLDQPMRSWLRAWFDENKTQIEAVLEQEYVRAFQNREPFSVAAERVALWMSASVQRRIRNGIAPPNSPITIEKKGSSTPLIDSGLFRSAIMSHVNQKRATS